MTTPAVIVFDLGKVLLDFDYSICLKKISTQTKMDLAGMQKFIDQSPLLYRFERGELSSEEFFAEVQARAAFSGSFSEFREMFCEIFSAIPEMVDLHARLKTEGYKTCVFSNTNALAIDHIRARFPFFNTFDEYVLSYEHGWMKPDPRLYTVVENMTGQRGEAILYLDDRLENIEQGAARGWRVIHHHDPVVTRRILTSAKILPD